MKLKKMFAVAVAEGRSAQQATARRIAEEMLGEVEKALAALSRAGFDAGTNLTAADKALSLAEMKLDSVLVAKGLFEESVATKVTAQTLRLLTEVAQLEHLRRQQVLRNFEVKNAPKEAPKKGKK